MRNLKKLLKLPKDLIKHPGSSWQIKKRPRITEKPPFKYWVFFEKIPKQPSNTSWVFFEKLKNVLKITKEPPQISWVLFAELRQNQGYPDLLKSTKLLDTPKCFLNRESSVLKQQHKFWFKQPN